MENKTDRIERYLDLSGQIATLEDQRQATREALQGKYQTEYAALKTKINAYMARVASTVQTVCTLHGDMVKLRGGVMYFRDRASQKPYTADTACDIALQAASESVGFLTAVLQRKNIEQNLSEFAVRYNTLVRIYDAVGSLASRAVQEAMEAYEDKIIEQRRELGDLFSSEKEFIAAAEEMSKRSDAFYQKAMLGDSKAPAKDFVTALRIPLGREVCEKKSLQTASRAGNSPLSDADMLILSLFEWDMQEDGILVIRAARSYFDGTELPACVVNAATAFLFAYPSTNKSLLLCDIFSSDAITAFAGILGGKRPEMFFAGGGGSFVKNTSEEIREAFAELAVTVNRRIMLLGQSNAKDVLTYNRQNQDNPIPLVLVVLNGYSIAQYDSTHEHISGLLKNGKKAGVYFLIVENADADTSTGYYSKNMPETALMTDRIVEYREERGKGYLHGDGKKYLTDLRGERYHLQSLLRVFEESHEENVRKVVDLENVVEKEDFAQSPRRQRFAKLLSVPFGKSGSDSVSVELDASGAAHLAVIGSTGSGKTAFMNTLILSMCKLYSPAELELHLIVMVKGGFKIFEEEQLPHCKTIVTGDQIVAANDVLDYIDEELRRREKLIGSYENIYKYNEESGHSLPRWVILIDEFYQLIAGSDNTNGTVDRITRIAQTGRAYGISLVVCSINFPMEINSLIALFGNRIEFKAEENAGQLISEAATRQSELDKGRCFFAHNGILQYVAVAFSGEGNLLKQHIAEIKSKFPDYHMALGNQIKTTTVTAEGDVPFHVRNARRQYEEEGSVRIRCGTAYLTNKSLEYIFRSTHNALFLLGNYLDTKQMEAALVKDVLVLSENIDTPTVYYIDYNKNAKLKRTQTIIKTLLDDWVLSGKMVYSGSDRAYDAFETVRDLIRERKGDMECDLSPILVIVSKADEILEDRDSEEAEILIELLADGKDTNVYFALQCSEPSVLYYWRKYIKDAVIFPDRRGEEDEIYTSSMLCAMLAELPAGDTKEGKRLIANAQRTPLHPKLHLLCVNQQVSAFVPYEYDPEYLKSIVE